MIAVLIAGIAIGYALIYSGISELQAEPGIKGLSTLEALKGPKVTRQTTTTTTRAPRGTGPAVDFR
jgi:hypothetical protein